MVSVNNVERCSGEQIVLSVAEGKTDKAIVAQFFRKNFITAETAD